MQDTRQDILQILREKGQASVGELAEALDLSPVTVHYHIHILQRDGLLKTTSLRQGVGRPHNVFSLRDEAREKFPQSYHRLSDRLLNLLKSSMSEAEIQHLFERMGEDIAAEQATSLEGKTLDQKIEALIDVLGEEGFLSRVEKAGDDFLVTQCSCPFYYVAERHPEVCELDLHLMNAALGAPIKRTAWVMNGDNVCAFHITANNP